MYISQSSHEKNVVIPKLKDAKKPRVLLIEDDRSTRRLVKSIADPYCTFIDSESARRSVNLFHHHSPDLVFLDIDLPDGCGHSLLQWMLTIDPKAFIVMFSAYSDNDNVWMSIEAGAKGFVTKPFKAEKILFFIQQCQM